VGDRRIMRPTTLDINAPNSWGSQLRSRNAYRRDADVGLAQPTGPEASCRPIRGLTALLDPMVELCGTSRRSCCTTRHDPADIAGRSIAGDRGQCSRAGGDRYKTIRLPPDAR